MTNCSCVSRFGTIAKKGLGILLAFSALKNIVLDMKLSQF